MSSRNLSPASEFEELTPRQRAAAKQVWETINLQADSLLKQRQNTLAPWSLLVSGAAAGGGLVALIGGIIALFHFR